MLGSLLKRLRETGCGSAGWIASVSEGMIPLRSRLLSWTDSRNGQDGNYLFELEAQPGGPERGSVTTASSKRNTSIEQPLKTSGPRSGLQLMDFAIRELTINRQRCALTAWEALFQALNGTAKHCTSVQLLCNCDEDQHVESPQPINKPP